MATGICPVCKIPNITVAAHPEGGDFSVYYCNRCGDFEITRTLEVMLSSKPANPKLSYALRQRFDSGIQNKLNSNNYEDIQNSVDYPTTISQRVDKMLLFMYNNMKLTENGFTIENYNYSLFGIDNKTVLKQIIKYASEKYYINIITKLSDGDAIFELASNGIDRIEGILKAKETDKADEENMEKTKKCFLVHGHDDTLKNEVARFIEKELKIDVIILHEQPGRSKTIIEKFEHYSDVDFAVCLFTGDDLGRSKNIDNPTENDLVLRARQNVVFEAGFFMGKLGRENVLILLDPDVEKPSDSDAINYISTKNQWKHELAKEIKAIYE
jgi:predicted nucleotide-binding protein